MDILLENGRPDLEIYIFQTFSMVCRIELPLSKNYLLNHQLDFECSTYLLHCTYEKFEVQLNSTLNCKNMKNIKF